MQKVDTRGWQILEHKVVSFFPKRNKYAILIPEINEGEKIKTQLKKMKRYSDLADIVLADGGTTDGSIESGFLRSQGVRAILFNTEGNKGGQGTQLRMGLAYCLSRGYQGVVTIDGNNKDDVNKIPVFLQSLREGYDYVQASRFIQGGEHKNTPFDRIFFNRFIISPLLSLTAKKWYTDTPNNFRAYSRKYLLHPKVKPFRKVFVRYEFIFYLVTRANRLGLKTKEIAVRRVYPKGKVPTKIVGIKKILDLVKILKVALGFYNP